MALVKFLVNFWSEERFTVKLKKVIYVTVESSGFRLSAQGTEEVLELESTQEEADTRLLLHAKHVTESGIQSIVIHADDTDIAVIALRFITEICSTGAVLYMKTGTVNRIKYINLSVLYQQLGNEICHALVGLHALTGCDTVSSFCGHGKVKAHTCLKKRFTSQQHYPVLVRNFIWQTMFTKK